MREYTVDINGVEHTMQLDDEDAERLGDRAKSVSSKQAKAPANKSQG